MRATAMIPITVKRIGLIVWLLENLDREISVFEATKGADVLNYHSTYTALKDLASGGYLRITKTKRYQVVDAPALVRQISLLLPFRSKSTIGFFLGGEMYEKMQRLSSTVPDLVFTLFSAAELLSPYVKTSLVHAYIQQEHVQNVKDALVASGGRLAFIAEADTFLLPTEHRFIFSFSGERGQFKIAPMGILLADLESYGGLAKEQANLIMKEWLSRQSV